MRPNIDDQEGPAMHLFIMFISLDFHSSHLPWIIYSSTKGIQEIIHSHRRVETLQYQINIGKSKRQQTILNLTNRNSTNTQHTMPLRTKNTKQKQPISISSFRKTQTYRKSTEKPGKSQQKTSNTQKTIENSNKENKHPPPKSPAKCPPQLLRQRLLPAAPAVGLRRGRGEAQQQLQCSPGAGAVAGAVPGDGAVHGAQALHLGDPVVFE